MAPRTTLTEGLKGVLTDVPVRKGFLQLGAVWDPVGGAEARLEAGAHLLPGLAAFGFASATPGRGPAVGVGARWLFDL